MFASLQRGLANWHMPVIRSGDDHRIDSRLFIEQLTIIVIHPGIGQFLHLYRTVSLPLIDIAYSDDLLINFCKFRDEVAPHLAPHSNTRK